MSNLFFRSSVMRFIWNQKRNQRPFNRSTICLAITLDSMKHVLSYGESESTSKFMSLIHCLNASTQFVFIYYISLVTAMVWFMWSEFRTVFLNGEWFCKYLCYSKQHFFLFFFFYKYFVLNGRIYIYFIIFIFAMPLQCILLHC